MKKKCCYVDCKGKVVGEYSFDIDLPKFPFCKKHKANVSRSLTWALLGEMKLSDAELGLKNKKRTNGGNLSY